MKIKKINNAYQNTNKYNYFYDIKIKNAFQYNHTINLVREKGNYAYQNVK